MRLTRSLLLGVAMVVALLGGTAFAFASVGLGGSPSHSLTITFPSADGLVNGSDVLEAGSKIGYISSIEPTQSNSATVTVQIDGAHWPLHQGLSADIRPKSLLGEKYVDLHDGAASKPAYDATQVLQASQNADPVELDQFINSLDPATRTAVRVLLDDLGAGIAGQGPDLNAAIAAGKANLANLAVTGQTLNDRDPDLDKILVGLDGLLGKITTSDQLNQLSQLIDNGQNVLNDIESVQQPFSRQFNDANAALADLNAALDGAVQNGSLQTALNIGPALVANLQQETSLLAQLGNGVTTSSNLDPTHGLLCNSSTSSNQPITSVTGLTQCSPLWFLIKGLVQGPTVSGGALEVGNPHPLDAAGDPIFRICLGGIPNNPATTNGQCDSTESDTASYYSAGDDSAAFAAWLGS